MVVRVLTSNRKLTEEDVRYMRKIEELVNEWLTRWLSENNNQLYEEHVKERNNSKAIIFKPPQSPSTDQPQPYLVNPTCSKQVIIRRLKEFIVNVIKGTELRLVIQKKVFKSDTDKGLNRLNMPIKQLESNEFLREDERRILRKEKEIEVMVLGPTLEMYEKPMKLKMWHMTNSVNYVLTTSWHSFWKENKKDLDQDSKIQVWSFRRDDEKLCFAVVRVGRYDK